MESQKNASNGGLEGREAVHVGSQTTVSPCDLLLRVFALALTLTAAIVLGVDKQNKVVPMSLVPTLPPVDVPVSAQWHYLSAFVYLVACNAIACSYATLSLLLSIGNRGKKKSLGLMITILDITMVALLFSSNGAATGVGLIGYEGNSHLEWKKVCGVFGKFCQQGAAALVLSLLGSLVFLLIVVLCAFRLHKKSK